jgi:hypothetical protein
MWPILSGLECFFDLEIFPPAPYATPPDNQTEVISYFISISEWVSDPEIYIFLDAGEESLSVALAHLLISAYRRFLNDPDILNALEICVNALCTHSQRAPLEIQESNLFTNCLDSLMNPTDRSPASPGAVIVVRTFLRFLFQDAPISPNDIENVIVALTIASERSSDHAEEVVLTLPAFISRPEAPEWREQIFDLMTLLTSEAESDDIVSRLLSCCEQLIRLDDILFQVLIDRGILPDLGEHVRSLATEPPYRVLPAMIHLIHYVRAHLSPDQAFRIAIIFPLDVYYTSLRTYDPEDVGQCLDLIALVLDSGFSDLDSFKPVLDDLLAEARFEIWAACLDFFYRGALTMNPWFFYLVLSSAAILRFAWYLDRPCSLGESYFGLLLWMSRPPADIQWEHRAHLLMSFFLNHAEAIEIPEPGSPFFEEDGSVLDRIRGILKTFSPEDDGLRFESRFTGEAVDLLKQANEIVTNLESLNSGVLVPIADSQ